MRIPPRTDTRVDSASSELHRLVRAKRRTQLSAVLVVSLLVAVAAFDIFGGAAEHWRAVLYNVFYSTLASLLASIIVSWVIFQQRIRDRQQQGRLMLGFLGLDPPGIRDQVAIVVPAFPVPVGGPEGTQPFQHPKGTDEIVEMIPDNLIKNWSEIANHAYARRDMLLVLDIARVLATAGLPPPHVVSDYDFLQAVHDSAPQRPRSHGLHMRTDSSGLDDPVRISHVVLVGLWSNLATMLLQKSDAVPLEIFGDGPEREIRLLVPNADGDMLRPPKTSERESGQNSEVAPHAVMAKFHLPDICLSILGGTNALGTARLGDFILRPPVDFKRLADAQRDDDLWLGIKCPPAGDRWGSYAPWCREVHSKFLAQGTEGLPLARLFGIRDDQTRAAR
jgi:hypothetical protein